MLTLAHWSGMLEKEGLDKEEINIMVETAAGYLVSNKPSFLNSFM